MTRRLFPLALATPLLLGSALAQAANVSVVFIGSKGSGTTPTCELNVKASNSLGKPVRALVVEYQAVDASTGKALGGGMNPATFSLAAGATVTTPVGSANAACSRVRLQAVKARCVTRGCEPGISQQGLAGIVPP